MTYNVAKMLALAHITPRVGEHYFCSKSNRKFIVTGFDRRTLRVKCAASGKSYMLIRNRVPWWLDLRFEQAL